MRSGPLWVAWAASPEGVPPCLAFAIGKRVGGAVVRNRLRRRLRAVVASLAPGPGDYLVGADPAAGDLSSSDLKALVRHALLALPPSRGTTDAR